MPLRDGCGLRWWSEAELRELGDMLVRGLSIKEIAPLSGRDHGEVRDKGRRGRTSLPWR